MSKKIIMDINTTFNISKKLSPKQLEILKGVVNSPGMYRRYAFSGATYKDYYAVLATSVTWTQDLDKVRGWSLSCNRDYTTHIQLRSGPFQALIDYGLITFDTSDPTIIVPTPFAKQYMEYHGL